MSDRTRAQTVADAVACSAASDHLLKNLDTYKPFSDTYKRKTYKPFSALKTKISDIVCLTTKAAPQHARGTGFGSSRSVTVHCCMRCLATEHRINLQLLNNNLIYFTVHTMFIVILVIIMDTTQEGAYGALAWGPGMIGSTKIID